MCAVCNSMGWSQDEHKWTLVEPDEKQPDPLAVAYKQGWTAARNQWKPRAEKAEAELKRLWKAICDREPAVILRDDQTYPPAQACPVTGQNPCPWHPDGGNHPMVGIP